MYYMKEFRVRLVTYQKKFLHYFELRLNVTETTVLVPKFYFKLYF